MSYDLSIKMEGKILNPRKKTSTLPAPPSPPLTAPKQSKRVFSLGHSQDMLVSTHSPLPASHVNKLHATSPSFLQSFLNVKRRKWRVGRRIKLFETTCSSCQIHQLSTRSNKPTIHAFLKSYPEVESSVSPSHNHWFAEPSALMVETNSSSSVGEANHLYPATIRLWGRFTIFACNNLISEYVKLGKIDDARKLFDRMPERTVVTWTALLNGYSKMGFEDKFLELYKMMIESHVRANSTTFVCILNFCSKALDFYLGRQIHACIVKGKWRNSIVDSTLIHFYSQFGDIFSAFRIFDGMEARDVVCWTAMITGCAQHGHGDEAISLFSRMQELEFDPNEFTVCSVLKACGEERALKFGRQLHGAVVKGVFKGDVYVGSSLVDMYMRCGEVEDATTVFDGMPRRNTVTWTAMIVGFVQQGLGEEALQLFQRMRRTRVFANHLTVVGILSACGIIGSSWHGKEIHGQILKNDLLNNCYIGTTLVWSYCKCGEYAYAARILELMPEKDVIAWTAMISGSTDQGHSLEALQYLNKMIWEGVDPNLFTYSSVLKACSNLDALSEGKQVHSSVSKTCSLANVYVGSALISLYMKSGCIEDASRVFGMMPEQNLISMKTMVLGYAKNGLCEEALKLMYKMQAEGFEVDDYVVSSVLTSWGDAHPDDETNSTHQLTG